MIKQEMLWTNQIEGIDFKIEKNWSLTNITYKFTRTINWIDKHAKNYIIQNKIT